MKKDVISIIGLGYVGLPLAVEFAKIYKVIGYDINNERVEDLISGVDLTGEVERTELINSQNNLKITSNRDDISSANIHIVTVPTPVNESNMPDFQPLHSACELIGGVLKKDDIVVFESTVYPGATEEQCVPILEEVSGLKYNKDFFCGYSPERINPGDKENKLTNIKKIVSGSNDYIAEKLVTLYEKIINAGVYKASTIKVAEAAKVVENSQRDINIAFMNELSIIFNKMGIDTEEVLAAAGTKWNFLKFKPGLVGGHCIGVDPYYLTFKAASLGYHSQVILSGRLINDEMPRYLARDLLKDLLRIGFDINKHVLGVMGVTFKENCPDIRNSKTFTLCDELNSWGIHIKIHDPIAVENEVLKNYNRKIEKIDSNNKVDALVVAVGHDAYKRLDANSIADCLTGDLPRYIADLKSIFSKEKLKDSKFSVYRM